MASRRPDEDHTGYVYGTPSWFALNTLHYPSFLIKDDDDEEDCDDEEDNPIDSLDCYEDGDEFEADTDCDYQGDYGHDD